MKEYKEAKRLQKEKETQIIIKFIAYLAIIATITFLLFRFTNIFNRSASYLIPIIALFRSIKKTQIYMFLTPREFIGEIINIDVYMVQNQVVKGSDEPYKTQNGFEAEIIIKKGNRLKSIKMPHGRFSANAQIGDKVVVLRFIDKPLMLEKAPNTSKDLKYMPK